MHKLEVAQQNAVVRHNHLPLLISRIIDVVMGKVTHHHIDHAAHQHG